jgi:hypothetical protein
MIGRQSDEVKNINIDLSAVRMIDGPFSGIVFDTSEKRKQSRGVPCHF